MVSKHSSFPMCYSLQSRVQGILKKMRCGKRGLLGSFIIYVDQFFWVFFTPPSLLVYQHGHFSYPYQCLLRHFEIIMHVGTPLTQNLIFWLLAVLFFPSKVLSKWQGKRRIFEGLSKPEKELQLHRILMEIRFLSM